MFLLTMSGSLNQGCGGFRERNLNVARVCQGSHNQLDSHVKVSVGRSHSCMEL